MRGITVAGMILVNTAGDFEHVYTPLSHAAWDGLHPADLVFPFFVFVMGVSLVLALGRARETGMAPRTLWPKVLRRTAILLALGLLVVNFPVFELPELRVTGVLQRIAIAYLVCAGVILCAPGATRGAGAWALLAIAFVAGYETLASFVPVPGVGAGFRTPEASLVAHVDRVLLGPHRHPDGFDPEGLLSTLPAIATTLLGMVAGRWLRESREAARALTGLLVAGLAGVAAGSALDPVIAVNKSLWSASFVLVTGGLAALLLGLLHAVIDVARLRRWALPFEAFGSNAIVLYVGSTLLNTTLVSIVVGPSGDLTLKEWLNHGLVWLTASPELASFLYSLLFLGLWLGVAALLWLRGIFIKV